MGFGRFVPPQNFNKPIGFPSSAKSRKHRSNRPGQSERGVKTNHGAGVPQRKYL